MKIQDFEVTFSNGDVHTVCECATAVDALTRAIESTGHKFSEVVKVDSITTEKQRYQSIWAWTDETALVSVMTPEELEEHLEGLEEEAFEAKARLEACRAEMQSRQS